MTQRDTYDGSDTPFQGDVVLRLRSIPLNARIGKAIAIVTPIGDRGGSQPFTEVIAIANHAGDFGTTEADTADWVEVDFHARRTLAEVVGSNLANTTLQVDVGGGTYVDISQTGGFLTPSGPPAFTLSGDSEILPSLTVTKLKLTKTGQNPKLSQVSIRSVPSNVSLRIGGFAPFWTHTGEMPLPETTPDFAAILQNFLTAAKVENGIYVVPLTVHSDTLARLRVDFDVDYVSQSTAIPSGLKEVVQPFDFSSVPQPQANVLSLEVPANSRVVAEHTNAKVKGGFAPTRVVLGPTGPVTVEGEVAVSPRSTLAQPFTLTDAAGVTGIDLLITCADATVSLQADIRADLGGKPDNPPLFRGPVDVSLEKKSAGENPAFWASVALPAQFHLEPKTYWLVLQSLNGNGTWCVSSASGNNKAVMQRSQDGGFSWRIATPQIPASGAPATGGPLAAFFRLRRKPDQYQVPIELLVGSGPTATRVKLDRFAPLGRVDFSPSAEVTEGVNQYLQGAAQSSHACPEGEQLANGNFEEWTVLSSSGGSVSLLDFRVGGFADGISAVVSRDGKFAYMGMNSDGQAQLQVIDVLCDRLDPASEIDFTGSSTGQVVVGCSNSRLYVAADRHSAIDLHMVDISAQPPIEIGAKIDTSKNTTGLSASSLVVSPDGTRLYLAGKTGIATSTGTAELLAFDTANLEQVARGIATLQPPDTLQIAAGQPTGLAISGDGNRLYLAVNGKTQQQMWVVDANAIGSGALQTINTTCQPMALGVTPGGTHAVVVGPPISGAASAGIASVIDLQSQRSADIPIGTTPTAVVVSPDGLRAFVAGTASASGGLEFNALASPNVTGNVAVVDLNRGRTDQTIVLDGTPVALAIDPLGSRIYVAKITETGTAQSTPINILATGSRVPAEWMLTAGAVKPYCVNGDIHTLALLGHVPAAGEPAPPDSGLSQVIPAAACGYDFSFWALASQDGAVGEVMWLGQNSELLRADQLPIQVWRPPGSGIPTPSPAPSPTPSPTASPAPNPEVTFERGLARQHPRLHRTRVNAPEGTVQAEVRFTVPSGELAAVGMASLAGTSSAVTNSDLQILEKGVPVGWAVSPAGAALSVSAVDGGIELQNGSGSTAALVQPASLQAKQKFALEVVGSSQREAQVQQNPSIELHWLKDDGSAAAPSTAFEIQPGDFDRVAGTGSVPDGTTHAEVQLIVPTGASLTIRELSLEPSSTIAVPISFIAASPGELTVSDMRVGYQRLAAPNPPVPAGGLATPTPPGRNPGEPGNECHCACCGEETALAGASAVKTPAGRPATAGSCLNCGATVVRPGGQFVASAPALSLPILRRISRPRIFSGQPVLAARREAPAKLELPLTAIAGIGNNREQQLKKSGIRSVRELAAARPQVVAAALKGVSLKNAPHFINEARRLLENEGR